MSAFYDNNVTDVGRLLLGDVQMGASFVPTKIVIGKGYLPQGKTTRTMTDVADVVKELALNKATKNPDGDAIFGAIFSNADIQEAFYYRELGLYAKGVYYNQSGDVERETAEVLYSYGNAGENAELIPAYSTGSVVERQLDLLVYIGNDTEVKLEIETGLYVTIPVFNDTVERLEKDIEEVRYIVDSTTAKKYEWAMESGTLSLDEVDGDTKINIADKETLDAVKGKVDLIHTNTEGLSGKIGQTNDSGGSEAAGSVFAKLNQIIGDIAAHVKQWTAERAAKLDQLDTINENAKTASTKATELVEDVAELKAAVAQETTVEGISNKIGEEGDVDTQPTLFGRLAQVKNVLLEKLAEVLGKVMGIDTKVDTLSKTTGRVKTFDGRTLAAITDSPAAEMQNIETASYNVSRMFLGGLYIVCKNSANGYILDSTDMSLVLDTSSLQTNDSLFGADSEHFYTIYKFGTSCIIKKYRISDWGLAASSSAIGFSSSSYEVYGLVDNQYIFVFIGYKWIIKLNKDTLGHVNQCDINADSRHGACMDDSHIYFLAHTEHKILKIDKSTMSLIKSVNEPEGMLNVLHIAVDDTSFYIPSNNGKIYQFNKESMELEKTANFPQVKSLLYQIDTQDSEFLYYIKNDGKVIKVSKSDLSVVSQSQDTFLGYLSVNDENIFAIKETSSNPTKISKTTDTIYQITGFKEVN